MKRIGLVALSIALLGSGGQSTQLSESLDLRRLLAKPKMFDQLAIEYESGDDIALFVYGTGAVVKQVRPMRAPALVPTCSGKVGQEKVRELIEAMVRLHFFKLPVRSYPLAFASDDEVDFWKALKVHSITIDDGENRAGRQFAEGVSQGRKEPIPQNFVAIEKLLQDMRQQATEGKPCHMAPILKLPPLDAPEAVPSSFRS